MKILSVTHFFESHRGGIEIVAGRLGRELDRLGHEVTWVASSCDRPPSDAWVRPVPIRTFNLAERLLGLPMPIPGPSGIARLVRLARDADALIVHDGLYLTSIIALVAARLASKPVLLVQHIGEIPFKSHLFRLVMRAANRLVTRPMLRAADQVVFISETTARHFGSLRYRRPPLSIFNGVDTSTFRPGDPQMKAELRAALGLDADRPIALFVGRFVEKKGLPVLRALARCRPDIQFALAGWGPINPEDWALPNVKVHRGLSGDRLADLYRASDALVLPSVGEGFPLVVQEALACDLPVLCGADTAIADPAAAHLLRGVAVDLTAPAETAQAFDAALDDVFSRGGTGAASRFARVRYSWSQVAKRYQDALRALAGNSAPAMSRQRAAV